MNYEEFMTALSVAGERLGAHAKQYAGGEITLTQFLDFVDDYGVECNQAMVAYHEHLTADYGD